MLRKITLLISSTVLVVGAQWSLAAEQATPPAKAAVSDAPAAKTAPKKAASKKTEPKKLLPSDLPTARILEKNTQARGGLKAWRAVKSMSMTGKMDAGYAKKKPNPDPASNEVNRSLSKMARIEAAIEKSKAKQDPGTLIQVPFTMELQRPRKSRLEIQYEGETAIQVYDGEKGWKKRPFLGRQDVEPYTAEELKVAALQTELDGALIDSTAKGYKVAVEGMEPVEGKRAYKLKVTMKDGQVRHVWVDAKTFLDVQIDATRELGGKPRAVYTLLRDYKSVQGLKIPHQMETKVEGAKTKTTEKIYVEKITLNPKLDDARFAKLQ